MPQTPEERRKTFEQLAEKRQQMLRDEREKQVARESEAETRTKRQKSESIAEQGQAAERGEKREEWRQEQHTKREEELESLRLIAEERARAEARKAKEAEAQEERTQRMRDIHDRAATQKVAARKLQAEHIEEEIVGHVDDQSTRDLRDVESVLERTMEHLTQDRRKKIAQLDDDATRQQRSLAERYLPEKKAEYKRSLLTLQERTAEASMKIESEYSRLRDEAVSQAEQKKARLRGLAEQRLREAKTRHESMDKWIDSHRG